MTGATNRHNQVKLNCLLYLGGALKGQRCSSSSDTKVRIREQGLRRFYYPDVQVVCQGNVPTDVFQDLPVLIIEVLSPSTRRYDLDEKLAAYLAIPSLECYAILEQHMPLAIVLRRTPDGFSRHHTRRGRVDDRSAVSCLCLAAARGPRGRRVHADVRPGRRGRVREIVSGSHKRVYLYTSCKSRAAFSRGIRHPIHSPPSSGESRTHDAGGEGASVLGHDRGASALPAASCGRPSPDAGG